MFDLSVSGLIVSTLVGSAGFVCFIYGKKLAAWKPMAGGVVLMLLPAVIRQPVTLTAGAALVLFAIYIFRD